MAELVRTLRDNLAEGLGDLPPDEAPPFEFRIGWSNTYTDLFSRQYAQITGIDEIVTRALRYGRVLLQAPGGGGKTVILLRLLRQRVDTDQFVVYVDLKNWTPHDYAEWDMTDSSDRLNYLLDRMALPKTKRLALSSMPAQLEKLVLVDGLNEMVPNTAQEILEVLGDFSKHTPFSGVVAADRIVRRELNESDAWQLAAVLPMGDEQIRTRLEEAGTSTEPGDMSLLRTPYFLDAAIKGGRSTSSVALHREYFAQHVNLTHDELQLVAQAAFLAYQRSKTRTFALALFEVDAQVLEKLRAAGALVVSGDRAYFVHHLKHDYLAAVHLAAHRELWNGDVFNIVTFRAASFDCLEMTLQLLADVNAGDALVQRMFDWNQYASAYSVAEGRRRGNVPITGEMEIALLANLAERRWDLIVATAVRVKDALQFFGTVDSERFLRANSLEIVQQLVRQRPFQGRYAIWANLFCRDRKDTISDAELKELSGDDSLVGWTLSNVLKRLNVSDKQQSTIRNMSTHSSPTVRWRVVHALGAFADKENVSILLRLLDRDKDIWVRYGAIRSVMENAARGDARLRKLIVDSLSERTGLLMENDRVLQELQRAIFVTRERAPLNWKDDMIELCRQFHDASPSMETRDRWERIAYRVRAEYS